jgi:hypothetical protein
MGDQVGFVNHGNQTTPYSMDMQVDIRKYVDRFQSLNAREKGCIFPIKGLRCVPVSDQGHLVAIFIRDDNTVKLIQIRIELGVPFLRMVNIPQQLRDPFPSLVLTSSSTLELCEEQSLGRTSLGQNITAFWIEYKRRINVLRFTFLMGTHQKLKGDGKCLVTKLDKGTLRKILDSVF